MMVVVGLSSNIILSWVACVLLALSIVSLGCFVRSLIIPTGRRGLMMRLVFARRR
jgi:hypothetical protein